MYRAFHLLLIRTSLWGDFSGLIIIHYLKRLMSVYEEMELSFTRERIIAFDRQFKLVIIRNVYRFFPSFVDTGRLC